MTDIHSMPGHLIRRLQQISNSVFSEGMQEAGVDITSPQFAALSILDQYPGIDQATLAGLIAHDRPTIGGVVERLVNKQLIDRIPNAKDRRAKVLTLTQKGKGLLAQLRPVVEKIQLEILPGLTADERDQFVHLAAKIAHAGNDVSRASLTVPKTPNR